MGQVTRRGAFGLAALAGLSALDATADGESIAPASNPSFGKMPARDLAILTVVSMYLSRMTGTINSGDSSKVVKVIKAITKSMDAKPVPSESAMLTAAEITVGFFTHAQGGFNPNDWEAIGERFEEFLSAVR